MTTAVTSQPKINSTEPQPPEIQSDRIHERKDDDDRCCFGFLSLYPSCCNCCDCEDGYDDDKKRRKSRRRAFNNDTSDTLFSDYVNTTSFLNDTHHTHTYNDHGHSTSHDHGAATDHSGGGDCGGADSGDGDCGGADSGGGDCGGADSGGGDCSAD